MATILGSRQAPLPRRLRRLRRSSPAPDPGLVHEVLRTSFLSRASRLVAERAGRRGTLEVGWLMRLPQVVLAGLCVALGLVPRARLPWLIGGRCARSPDGLGAAPARHSRPCRSAGRRDRRGRRSGLLAPLVVAAASLALVLLLRLARHLSGSAGRRAAWRSPGSAATPRRRSPTATAPTTCTARSSATSAGSAGCEGRVGRRDEAVTTGSDARQRAGKATWRHGRA